MNGTFNDTAMRFDMNSVITKTGKRREQKLYKAQFEKNKTKKTFSNYDVKQDQELRLSRKL